MGNIRAGTLIKFTKLLTVQCESWHPTLDPENMGVIFTCLVSAIFEIIVF